MYRLGPEFEKLVAELGLELNLNNDTNYYRHFGSFGIRLLTIFFDEDDTVTFIESDERNRRLLHARTQDPVVAAQLATHFLRNEIRDALGLEPVFVPTWPVDEIGGFGYRQLTELTYLLVWNDVVGGYARQANFAPASASEYVEFTQVVSHSPGELAAALVNADGGGPYVPLSKYDEVREARGGIAAGEAWQAAGWPLHGAEGATTHPPGAPSARRDTHPK